MRRFVQPVQLRGSAALFEHGAEKCLVGVRTGLAPGSAEEMRQPAGLVRQRRCAPFRFALRHHRPHGGQRDEQLADREPVRPARADLQTPDVDPRSSLVDAVQVAQLVHRRGPARGAQLPQPAGDRRVDRHRLRVQAERAHAVTLAQLSRRSTQVEDTNARR